MPGYVYQCGLHSPLSHGAERRQGSVAADRDPTSFFKYLAKTRDLPPNSRTHLDDTETITAKTSYPSSRSLHTRLHQSSLASQDAVSTFPVSSSLSDVDAVTTAPCNRTHDHPASCVTAATTSSTSPSPIAPPSYSTSAIDCSMWTLPNRTVGNTRQHGEPLTEAPAHTENTFFSSLVRPPGVALPPHGHCHAGGVAAHAEEQTRANPEEEETRCTEPSDNRGSWMTLKATRFTGRSVTPSGSLGTTTSHGVSLSADAADRSELSFGGCGACMAYESAAAPQGALSLLVCPNDALYRSPQEGEAASPVPVPSNSALPNEIARTEQEVALHPHTKKNLCEVRALFLSSDEDELPGSGDTEAPAYQPVPMQQDRSEKSVFHASPPPPPSPLSRSCQDHAGEPNSVTQDAPSFEDVHCVTLHGLPHSTEMKSVEAPPPAAVGAHPQTAPTASQGTESLLAATTTGLPTAGAAVDCGLVFSSDSPCLTAAMPTHERTADAAVTVEDSSRPHSSNVRISVQPTCHTPVPVAVSGSVSLSPLRQHCLRRLARQQPPHSSAYTVATPHRTPDRRRYTHSSASPPASNEYPVGRRAALGWPAHTPLTRSMTSLTAVERRPSSEGGGTAASTPSPIVPTPLRYDGCDVASCPIKSTDAASPFSPDVRAPFPRASPTEAAWYLQEDRTSPSSWAEDPAHAFTGFPTPIKFSPIPTKRYAPAVHTPSSSTSLSPQSPMFGSPVQAKLTGVPVTRGGDGDDDGPSRSGRTQVSACSTVGCDATMRPTSAATLFGPASFSCDDTNASVLANNDNQASDEGGADGRRVLCDDSDYRDNVYADSLGLTPIQPSLTMTTTQAFDHFDKTVAGVNMRSPNSVSPVTPLLSPTLAPSEESTYEAPCFHITIPGKSTRALEVPVGRPSTIHAAANSTRRSATHTTETVPRTTHGDECVSKTAMFATPQAPRPVVKTMLLSPSVLGSPPTPLCQVSVRSLVESALTERRDRGGTSPCHPAASTGFILQTSVPQPLSRGLKPRLGGVTAYLDIPTSLARSSTARIDSWL